MNDLRMNDADTHKEKTIATNQEITDLLSPSRCVMCLATWGVLFTTSSAIILDEAPQWAWLVVVGTVALSAMIIQRPSIVAPDDNVLHKAHLLTMARVIFMSRKIVAVQSFGNTHLDIILALLVGGVFSLWLVRNPMTRHNALVFLARHPVVLLLIISLVDTKMFARYVRCLLQESNVATFLNKLGIGFVCYYLRLSYFEFVWKTTTILAVFMPSLIWTSDGVNALHVDVAFQAVVHSISLLAFAAVSDRRYRMFSLEWMYTVAAKNVTGIVVTVMCLALYCQLTSQMLLLALFLAAVSAIVFLVRKHGQRRESAQDTTAHNGVHFAEGTEEALAIRRFQLSYKPFVAFSIVCMIFELAIAFLNPSLQVPMMLVVVFHIVTVTIRCYLVDADNQGHARWLFGWLWMVSTAIAVVAGVAMCPAGKTDRVVHVFGAISWVLYHAALNISGIPGPCRLFALIANAYTIFSLPIVYEDDYAKPGLVVAMLFGEVVGRLSVQQGRVNAIEEADANKYFQSSFKLFLVCSAIFVLLELYIAAVNPGLAFPCGMFLVIHITITGGRWHLLGYADSSRARWLFGWGWAIVSIVRLSAFAVVQQERTMYRLGTGVVCGMAAMWLLTLIYLNVVGAPWLARWTMLCLMAVLNVSSPLLEAHVPSLVLGAMMVGELIGQLWVHRCRINLPSIARWRSLAFEDEAKEREYVTKHFKGSYSTMILVCTVALILSCIGASCFPHDDMRSLLPMMFWLMVLGLRVHTELTVPMHDKRARFGFGMVMITLLLTATWVGVQWMWFFNKPAPPVAIACCIMLFVICGKVICLPECHRQAINVITVTGSVAAAPSSSIIVTACQATVLVVTALVVEFSAYMLDQKRRSLYQASGGLCPQPSIKETQMKFALDMSPTATCIADAHTKLVYVNPAALAMFGYAEEELIGQSIDVLMMPPIANKHDETVQQLPRTGVSSMQECDGREIKGIHKDGHNLNLSLTFKAATDRTLSVMSFCNVVLGESHGDLSAEVPQRFPSDAAKAISSKAELAVNTPYRRSTDNDLVTSDDGTAEVHVRQADHCILENIPGLVLVKITMDLQSHLSVDGDVFEVTGYTAEEFVALDHVCDFLSPDADRKKVASLFASMVDENQSLVEVNIPYIHKDGHTIWLRACHGSRATGTAVDGTQNVLAVFRDVTATVLAQQQVECLKKDHAERFQSVCGFLSHEIRNQLYPQSVILEEMKDEHMEWTDNVNMILSANANINRTLELLLDLSKWESGTFPVSTSLFPIRRLFKNVADYADANAVTVDGLELIESSWYVTADEHLLKQAATNLISNASKFSNGLPVRAMVAFERTSQKEGVIVVTVTDKGRGMTAEQLTKVMVPFQHLRKAGEARSGTGLGLPLTKAMIELGHKGTLTLASEGLGKGTTATMRVPVQWMSRYETPPQDSDPLWWVKPHPGATADILIVDDVRMNRMMTIFVARKLGLSFHEAVDGEEALELLRTNTYSMVFMDRQMPVMTGDVATEQARANGYSLPIVMVSGDTFSPQERAELKRRGMTAFLGKMSVPGTRHAMIKLKSMKK